MGKKGMNTGEEKYETQKYSIREKQSMEMKLQGKFLKRKSVQSKKVRIIYIYDRQSKRKNSIE